MAHSTPDPETLAARLAAVERALTDGADADLVRAAEAIDRLDVLADRLDAIESRLAAAEADVDAVRGVVGDVEHVNDAVERRADLALARVDELLGPSADVDARR